MSGGGSIDLATKASRRMDHGGIIFTEETARSIFLRIENIVTPTEQKEIRETIAKNGPDLC